MPEHDLAIELQYLRFQRMQLGTQSCDTGTCHLRDSFVFRIGEDIEELFEAFAADRRHDAKLGKVGADRVDHRGLLTDEQVPRTMKDQAALLLRRLGLDKPHLALVTASQIASASAASFFCRLT